MKPLLIIGREGQLARALARSLMARREPFLVTGSAQFKAATEENLANTLISAKDIRGVINTIAYTNVDGAETNPEAANRLNHTAPKIMAKTCAAQNLPFIHISTDYVFDGKAKTPYSPPAKTSPLNIYGHSKLRGEQAVMDIGASALILRTSWLYNGTSKNFLTTMLGLAKDGDVPVVHDQTGRPTYAGHLAEACLTALSHMPPSPKIYHVTNSGPPATWADFAREIFRQDGIKCRVKSVTTSAFPRPAIRPAYSVLDIQDFENDFSHRLLPWQTGLAHALKERP